MSTGKKIWLSFMAVVALLGSFTGDASVFMMVVVVVAFVEGWSRSRP
jgi:hypothetical protein